MYESILDALRRGDATAAVAAARDAVTAQPQDPTAHRLLANALRLQGDTAGARDAIDAALALAPDNADMHLERAGLLLGERQIDEAQAALARSLGLDPNQFSAYILQAHLALGRGDLDEAERITRTAARIAPEHPQIAALEGTLALRRGDAERALKLLSAAAERAPEEPTLRHALAFAYLANGHFAFAEQAFRSLLSSQPDSRPLRGLIAQLVARQGRPGDAADELAPLLDTESSPALQRTVAELELQAGRFEQAMPRLRALFEAAPTDRRTLGALVTAWQQLGAIEDARSVLDGALVEHAQSPDLWHARLLFEPFAGPEARAIIERWRAAMPDFVPALQAHATVFDAAGETEQAEALALRITELEPGHTQAEMRVIDGLLRRDPEAAIARIDSLLERADDAGVKQGLRSLLGRALDVAGQPESAAATWAELHAEVAEQRLPLPPHSAPIRQWPPLAPLPADAPGVLLLWGAPGSLVERIAVAFEIAGAPLRADRFGAQPPHDDLQRYTTVNELVSGGLDGAQLVERWRALLPARNAGEGNIFDWLLWWDNALLLALRPHLPEAVVMVALRDPRDMLLDWLAFGAPMPLAVRSPNEAARWLAQVLAQIAELHERDLFPHRLVRMDDIADDPVAVAYALGQALDIQVPPAPDGAFGPRHFPAGHWRSYRTALADAFALLEPVAQRLGYPAA